MSKVRNTENQDAWHRIHAAAVALGAELLAAGKIVPPATTGTKPATSGGDTSNAGPSPDPSPIESAMQRMANAAREMAIAAEEKKIRAKAEARNREIPATTLREMAIINLQRQAELAIQEREQRRQNDHGRDCDP